MKSERGRERGCGVEREGAEVINRPPINDDTQAEVPTARLRSAPGKTREEGEEGTQDR